MQPTRRLFSVAVLIGVLSVVGFVPAYVFQWPSEFVIGEVTEHNATLADIVTGTVTSLPFAPWVALILFALLARSRRWWGTLAVIVLCLLGVLFVIGGLGEVFTPPTRGVRLAGEPGVLLPIRHPAQPAHPRGHHC